MNDYLIKKRLSKTRIIGRVLARLPFVRCVILNGSLTQGKSKESSDIDILIIAKDGRIFTARFFVNVLATILGIKRPKDDSKSHAGKFCFNYFLTEDFLKVPEGRGEKIDRYCAENYSSSKFVAGDRELFERFMEVNQELFKKYKCYPEPSQLSSPRRRGSRKSLHGFRITSGMTARAGDWFEKIAKKYQIKRIESDPRTQKYPDLIVYNDKELRFHPPKQS